MNRTRKPSTPRTKTTQARLQRLSTVLIVMARTIGFVAAIIGIFKARKSKAKSA